MGAKGTKHKNPPTHCKRGHEFTEDNVYIPPNETSRHCRKCRLFRASEYTDRNREHINERKRNRRSTVTKQQRRKENLRQIGWTPELFNQKVEEQEGKCEICHRVLTFEDKISGTRACADHIHSTPPLPRGVLCTNCNLGIGNLQENEKIMESAIAYVRKYKGGVTISAIISKN